MQSTTRATITHRPNARLLYGIDAAAGLRQFASRSVHSVVTSPPYWNLRQYTTHVDELGGEDEPQDYVTRLVATFDEVARVLRDDGTVWLNLGDTYMRRQSAGKPKDLAGIPWTVALALRDRARYLRADIVWSKRACLPEAVTDRPTRSHEYIFLLAKSERDADAIREPAVHPADERGTWEARKAAGHPSSYHRVPARARGIQLPAFPPHPGGRNKRSVWDVMPSRFGGAHFATFSKGLVEPCILAGCPVGGTVLDPFAGAATTGVVALHHQRNFVGIDLDERNLAIAVPRLQHPSMEERR